MFQLIGLLYLFLTSKEFSLFISLEKCRSGKSKKIVYFSLSNISIHNYQCEVICNIKSSRVKIKKMHFKNCKEDCEMIGIALYAYIGSLESHFRILSHVGVVRVTSNS